jgi:hypothetical protein
MKTRKEHKAYGPTHISGNKEELQFRGKWERTMELVNKACDVWLKKKGLAWGDLRKPHNPEAIK